MTIPEIQRLVRFLDGTPRDHDTRSIMYAGILTGIALANHEPYLASLMLGEGTEAHRAAVEAAQEIAGKERVQ